MPVKFSPTEWYGRPVLKPSHLADLERDAAMREFGDGLPREEAEEAAYKEYSDNLHRVGAAFHLRGMKAAQAAGDLDEARLHGDAYKAHMDSLGHDTMDQVPPEIANLADSKVDKVYKFKPHLSDSLLHHTTSDDTVIVDK